LRQHEQIWDKTMDALDKLVEILGESRETIGDFAKIFEEGMTDLGLAPPSLDQLVVGDLRRSRFGELKALIVLGANEGLMPSRPETSGLLDDADRSFLAEDGMRLAKDHIAKIYEEEFLIYANFSKPREYLAVSYHNGNLEGGASMPTRLIERLTELFPKIAVTWADKIPADSVAHIAAPRAAFGDMTAAMGVGGNAVQLAPIYAHAYDFFSGKPEFAARLKNIRAAAAFAAQAHALSRNTTKSLYGRHMRTSVSKLERFINCPFSYFVEYNLGAKPRRLYEATAVDMGNIYHDILARFGAMIQQVDNFGGMDEAKAAEMVNYAIDRTLANPENQILGSSGKYKHYARRMRQISLISAEALTKHLQRGDFKLVFNEVAFSDYAKNDNDLLMGAIEIPLDEASMFLDGRIDRVDMGEIDGNEYVKIIDYKSGQRRFSLSEAFYGLDMQLLIYLYAFIQKLSGMRDPDFARNILPAAAFYFNLLNPVVAYDRDFGDNPDVVKDEILRNFKMSGIVLEESGVIYAMDRNLAADSQIIPVSLKKDSTKDALSLKKESATISAEGFFALMGHVMDIAKRVGGEILKGNIDIAPANHRDKHPCRYCGYRSICKFDAADAPSGVRGGYRHMQYLRNDEVIAKILEGKN
jgi:ATP-dependent helicase/nuclease subunit B